MIKGGLNHFSDPVFYQLIMSHKKGEMLWLIKYISIVLFLVTLKEMCTHCTDGAILKKHDAIFRREFQSYDTLKRMQSKNILVKYHTHRYVVK